MTGRELRLEGLDGTNPLGFLAALGTLVTSDEIYGNAVRLGWQRTIRWVPVLHGAPVRDGKELAAQLANRLRGQEASPAAQARREKAQKAMEAASKAFRQAMQRIKKAFRRGSERKLAIEQEVKPLEREYQEKRRRWFEALREVAPSPELSLGKRIEDATPERYRELAMELLSKGKSARISLYLLSAFGSDACVRDDGKLESTLFQFATGSGHQFFLQDVGRLMQGAAPQMIERALFQPWEYEDEGLSLRWDPSEDRRYALQADDPSSTKTRTVWGANLLAYRALALYTTAARGKNLEVPGWFQGNRTWYFTWPLWQHPVTADEARSLVQNTELIAERPNGRTLRARGVLSVYRSERITVGSGTQRKINFAPAARVA